MLAYHASSSFDRFICLMLLKTFLFLQKSLINKNKKDYFLKLIFEQEKSNNIKHIKWSKEEEAW